MELREYWEILWRRWWVIVAVTVLAALSSVAFSWQLAPPPFKATIRLAVKPQIGAPTEKFYNYDEYYAYVASEYLVDDVINVIESPAFQNDLRAKLQGQLAGGIGAIEGKKAHRVMTVGVTTASSADALRAAQEIGTLLSEQGSKYFANISAQNPVVTIVDPPSAIQLGESRRAPDLILRVVLGLLVGIGLAFLLDYLSDTIRGAAHLERTIDLPILGEIPRETGRLRRQGA